MFLSQEKLREMQKSRKSIRKSARRNKPPIGPDAARDAINLDSDEQPDDDDGDSGPPSPKTIKRRRQFEDRKRERAQRRRFRAAQDQALNKK